MDGYKSVLHFLWQLNMIHTAEFVSGVRNLTHDKKLTKLLMCKNMFLFLGWCQRLIKLPISDVFHFFYIFGKKFEHLGESSTEDWDEMNYLLREPSSKRTYNVTTFSMTIGNTNKNTSFLFHYRFYKEWINDFWLKIVQNGHDTVSSEKANHCVFSLAAYKEECQAKITHLPTESIIHKPIFEVNKSPQWLQPYSYT